MKKLLTLLLLTSAGLVYSQDTSAYRMIAVQAYDADISFFKEDSTDLASALTGAGTGHGLFMNPADSLLYAILDVSGATSDRNLYTVNPFDGTYSLVHDYMQTYIAAADLGEGGIIYSIDGTAGGDGIVVALDLNTMTESTVYTSSMNGSGSARSIEYNPVDSSLYIIDGYGPDLHIYDLATSTESSTTYTPGVSEIHGMYHDPTNDVMHLGDYSGNMYTASSPYTAYTEYYVSGESVMDLCYLDFTLRSDTSYYEFCPGTDSVMISHIYSANSFAWYRDGVLLPAETNDTIWAKDDGIYQCIFEIGTTGNYLWSEGIELDLFTVPNVTITGDSLLCGTGATGVLTGAPGGGGGVQWYLNGSPLAGETNQTLNISAAGVYNQLKTNMSGCSDSSATSFVVDADPTDITVTITAASGDTEICPGETIVLTGEAGTVQWYLDGGLLTGETNSTLNATAAGNYNQTLTLMSGCSDSAVTSFSITVDPLCGAGIESNEFDLHVFPNPVIDQLNILSSESINSVQILDLSGKVVFDETNIISTNYFIDMNGFEKGAYVVKVQLNGQTLIRRIVK